MDNKLTNGNLRIIKNNSTYWEFIREVRNHSDIKTGFIEQGYITKETHENYMAQYGSDYIICLYNDFPAGFAGSINGDIRVATHPDFLRNGVARKLISSIRERNPSSIAKIKIDNLASLELFKKCGFQIKYYLLEADSSINND